MLSGALAIRAVTPGSRREEATIDRDGPSARAIATARGRALTTARRTRRFAVESCGNQPYRTFRRSTSQKRGGRNLIPHAEDGQFDLAARLTKENRVSRAFFQERAPERRAPRDVSFVEIDLVFSDDAVRRPRSRFVFDFDESPKEHGFDSIRARHDDRRALEALRKPVDAPVDLPELALAVDVLGVLAPVSLRGGVSDILDDLRAVFPEKLRMLELEFLGTLGRDVIGGVLGLGSLASQGLKLQEVAYEVPLFVPHRDKAQDAPDGPYADSGVFPRAAGNKHLPGSRIR